MFQSCIPVASGIAFTAWTLGPVELVSAALALTAGLWIYVLAAKAKLTAQALIFNWVSLSAVPVDRALVLILDLKSLNGSRGLVSREASSCA